MLALAQISINPAFGNQRFMITCLCDTALINDQNMIGVTNRCQAVSNDYRCSAFGKRLHSALDLLFGRGVKRASWLIQQQNRGITKHGSGMAMR